MSWTPEGGEAITGVVNMPSYPLFDYKQDNHWTPPGTQLDIKFWLQIDAGLDPERAWTLDARNSSAVLVVTNNDVRRELREGDHIQLPGGELTFEKLTMWMGYRVFYDPTIQWMFFIAVAGVLGLGYHFWQKINLQPWTEEESEENLNAPLSEPFKQSLKEQSQQEQNMRISTSGQDLATTSKGRA